MPFRHVVIQIVLGREAFLAKLATIAESAREVNILNMLFEIPTVLAGFSTECALVEVEHCVVPDYILIEQSAIPT